jgi:predicted AAA+ superfamily ATPase
MELSREIYKKLENEMSNNKILALVGLRQVGKTTLMKKLYSKFEKTSKFITFENIEILDMFENDLKLFIKKYVENTKYLFIDEIQYSKKGGKTLKFIFDTYNLKVIISGSSKPEISINSLQFLVGRVFIYNINPISFKEFINFKSNENYFLFKNEITQKSFKLVEKEFYEYLKFGGYPEVVIEKEYSNKKKILKNIENTYLLKEIKEILQYKNIIEYLKLLKRLAINDGGIANKNNISAEIGVNNMKISEMISILDNTKIIQNVKPFLKNKTKELIKSSKLYFSDIGFKNSIINNFNELDLRSDKGQIYESFILSVLIYYDLESYFFNYKNLNEIDFVIEKDGEIYGFEVKSKLQNDKLTPSIKKFCEVNNPKIIYVFNETIESNLQYKNTKIVFLNYLNIFSICEKISN